MSSDREKLVELIKLVFKNSEKDEDGTPDYYISDFADILPDKLADAILQAGFVQKEKIKDKFLEDLLSNKGFDGLDIEDIKKCLKVSDYIKKSTLLKKLGGDEERTS